MPVALQPSRPGGKGALTPAKLAWLHVPKAGTSFANVLVTWGCPGLPDDSVVDSTYGNGNGQFVPGFMHMHRDDCQADMTLCGSGHVPIGGRCNEWESHKGGFVALFRQPEQRALSGFYHNRHDVSNKSLDLPGYARTIAGCSVRMLNGLHCGDEVPATGEMVAEGVRRLDEGFAFVGLTDEWARSVCLFHLMHGGPCHEREFLDVRPGAQHSNNDYDTSGLRGWTDPYDGPLYARASEIFRGNVEAYGASDKTCSHLCPRSKGAFASEELVGMLASEPVAPENQPVAPRQPKPAESKKPTTAFRRLPNRFITAFDTAMAAAEK